MFTNIYFYLIIVVLYYKIWKPVFFNIVRENGKAFMIKSNHNSAVAEKRFELVVT